MSEITTLTVLELVGDWYESERPAILINGWRRRVHMILIKRSAFRRMLLKGEERLTMAHYRHLQLGFDAVMFYLPATVYWCGGLQPEHDIFFRIEGSDQPLAWRALVLSGKNLTNDLHEYMRLVQFIDEPTARAMTDAHLIRTEKAAALSGQAVQHRRPWETNNPTLK